MPLSTLFGTGFLIHVCACQVRWPVSVRGLFCLCFLSWCTRTGITDACCLLRWLYLGSRDSNSGSLAWVPMLDPLDCFPTATYTNVGGVGLLLTPVPDAIDGCS